MDDKREAKVRTDFKARANKASKYIDKINKKVEKNDELKITTDNFEISLKAQSIILNDLKNQPENKVTDDFIKDVDDVTSKISERNNHDNKEDKKNDADKEDSLKIDSLLK